VGGVAPVQGSEVAEAGAGADYRALRSLELVRTGGKGQRTRWWGSNHKIETRGEITVEGKLQVGQANSSEKSRPREGGIGCAKAQTSSGEGRGNRVR
jgi:hypothetical protein